MQEIIEPAGRVSGAVVLPGDKSISHRYALIGALAEGTTRIHNFATGEDCHSTLRVLRGLGVQARVDGSEAVVEGVGLEGLKAPEELLDAGNSGTTMRMMAGILAAQPFVSEIGGDASLSRRPMDRVIRPLAEMGAKIEAVEGRFPPLRIEGRQLHAIDYTLPVASAQVKSCILLAGLFAEGVTVVREPVRTRDHTEIALREFGAALTQENKVIRLEGGRKLTGRKLRAPGDLSSAVFFLVAGLLAREGNLVISGVGLNPTRSLVLDFLLAAGANIRILNLSQQAGEVVGDLLVRQSRIKGGVIEGALTAALIDEIPALAVLGAMSENGLEVKDARELRVKETDRIATIAENMQRMGVAIEVNEDGFRIPGRQKFRAATVDSCGDHRIAMAFSVAALNADGPCVIENAEAASVSFPTFYETLRQVSG